MRDRLKDIKFVKSANARPRMNREKDQTRLLWQKLRSRTQQFYCQAMLNRSDKPYTGDGKSEPKLPKSREETHGALDQYETFSCQDEKMIYINSSETNIVIFSTETILLPSVVLFVRRWYMCANVNSKNVRKSVSTKLDNALNLKLHIDSYTISDINITVCWH